MKQKIGLVGVGNIGKFYAKTLLDAGYQLTVFDVDKEKVEYAVRLGAQAAVNAADLAGKSQVIILSLPGSNAVEDVMEGKDGILSSLVEGQVVIDTGTSRPETDIKYEKICAEKGAGFIDAPLTWRKPGQIIMVGGNYDTYKKVEEILECISYKIKHVGPVGSGQVLKLINQAYLAAMWAVEAEVVELAGKQGVDPHLLKDFLEFDINDALFGDDFESGGQLALHYKDLGYLMDMAHESGAYIPICSFVHEIFKTTKQYGDPDWFQPGIITYWRRLNQLIED
ncbi:MAG: NAD(P)-dependent oxidoreductase [Clostridiales bacterium]|nr:NAD(P)-dependent oxidoreductase [Clostridiales bacterium]